MTKAINDATLNKVGDIYQYLIALKDCFELNDGDTLQIETNGDVSIINDIGESKKWLSLQKGTGNYIGRKLVDGRSIIWRSW